MGIRKANRSRSIQGFNYKGGEGKINNITSNSRKISFNYVSESPSIVRVNTIYYPGWTAVSDGKQKAIFYDNKQGVMDLKLTSGNQNITLFFTETPLRIISDMISFVSLLVLVALALYKPVLAKIKK